MDARARSNVSYQEQKENEYGIKRKVWRRRQSTGFYAKRPIRDEINLYRSRYLQKAILEKVNKTVSTKKRFDFSKRFLPNKTNHYQTYDPNGFHYFLA